MRLIKVGMNCPQSAWTGASFATLKKTKLHHLRQRSNPREQQSMSKQHIRAKMNGIIIQARELMRHDGRRVLSFTLVWKVHMRTGNLT